MSGFAVLGDELGRVQGLRAGAEEELSNCLRRVEELHTYIGYLTEEIGELVSDRGAVLARRRKASNQESDPACVCGEINTRHCPVHAGPSSEWAKFCGAVNAGSDLFSILPPEDSNQERQPE